MWVPIFIINLRLRHCLRVNESKSGNVTSGIDTWSFQKELSENSENKRAGKWGGVTLHWLYALLLVLLLLHSPHTHVACVAMVTLAPHNPLLLVLLLLHSLPRSRGGVAMVTLTPHIHMLVVLLWLHSLPIAPCCWYCCYTHSTHPNVVGISMATLISHGPCFWYPCAYTHHNPCMG
jgi:hypothetical protein